MERKLTAILAADVVGYSRLMEADEPGTLTRLKALLKDIFEPKIAEHHGRVVKTTGDGLLVEFPSVVEAVQCGVEVEKANALRNADVPADRRIEFRIGINLGDVIADGGDIYGDGVNVAARLEGMAEPGGICISGVVLNQVKNKVELRVENLGTQHVKNMAEPLSVYRVLLDAGAPGTVRPRQRWTTLRSWRAAAAVLGVAVLAAAGWFTYDKLRLAPPETAPSPQAARGMPAIAVLPFDNMSDDKAMGYFSDGVAEDIITMLSRFPDLAVVARNSSFTYKGKAVDVRQVGKELGVAYVLEGSVRKEADKVRIVAQLIDARTGQHAWAQRYENAGPDPWILQDEVVGKIITSLTGEMGQVRRAEYKQAWGKDTANLEEYDYYLRGHEVFMAAQTKDDYKRAQRIWEEGLKKFPYSSLLRIKLGFGHYMAAWTWNSDDLAGDFKRASDLAREGLAGQSLSPQTQRLGHWLMAYVKSQERDFDRAWAEAEAAAKLAPYDAYMLGNLANVATMAGRPDKAIEWLQIEVQRSPDVNRFYRFGAAYYVAGRYEEAITAFLKAERPWVADDYLNQAATYVRLDRMEDAKAAVKEALKLDPQFTQAKWREGYFYSDPSILERQVADLGKAGLPEK
jgi:TolB-like protein/class 3 adenylate cyclase/tetratricopeptide (TPR) repeat protein